MGGFRRSDVKVTCIEDTDDVLLASVYHTHGSLGKQCSKSSLMLGSAIILHITGPKLA